MHTISTQIPQKTPISILTHASDTFLRTNTHFKDSHTHTHTHTAVTHTHTHTHTHTQLSHTHTHTQLSHTLTHAAAITAAASQLILHV